MQDKISIKVAAVDFNILCSFADTLDSLRHPPSKNRNTPKRAILTWKEMGNGYFENETLEREREKENSVHRREERK